MPRAEHLTKRDVASTMEWMKGMVNQESEEQKKLVDLSNRELLEQFCQKQISRDELLSNWRPDPLKIARKSFRHMATKFLKKKNFTKQATNTSGNYLSFDDEKMVEPFGFAQLVTFCLLLSLSTVYGIYCIIYFLFDVERSVVPSVPGIPRSRRRFNEIRVANDVPWELILNYDQSWINAYRDAKTALRRKRTHRPSRTQTRVLHIVGGRKGISLCTSSFANGDPGPLFASLSKDSVSDAYVAKMNESLACQLESIFGCLFQNVFHDSLLTKDGSTRARGRAEAAGCCTRTTQELIL